MISPYQTHSVVFHYIIIYLCELVPHQCEIKFGQIFKKIIETPFV